jgi:hypothetical protein
MRSWRSGEIRVEILAGKRRFSETILFLVLIKKFDWTLVPPAISLTRWISAQSRRSLIMKLVGFLLMLAGWFLVLAALEMLDAATPRALFVFAGFAVEVLGLALVFRANLVQPEDES